MSVIDDVLKVLDDHPEGLDFNALREATGLGHSDLDQALIRLDREELVIAEDDGSYRRRGPLDAGRTKVDSAEGEEEEGEPEGDTPGHVGSDAPAPTAESADGKVSVVDAFHEDGKAGNVFVVLRADGESQSMYGESEGDVAKAVLADTPDEMGIAVVSLAEMHRWRTRRELERDEEAVTDPADVVDAEVIDDDEIEAKDGTLLSFMGQVQCRNDECDDQGRAWEVRFTRELGGDPEDPGLTDWSNEVGTKTCAVCGRDGEVTEETRARMEGVPAEELPTDDEVSVEVKTEG